MAFKSSEEISAIEIFRNNLVEFKDKHNISNLEIVRRAEISEKVFYNIMNLNNTSLVTIEKIISVLDDRPISEWLAESKPIDKEEILIKSIKETLNSFALFLGYKKLNTHSDKIAKDIVNKLKEKGG